MAKATIATVKSFIRKNEGVAYINEKSRFDGMTDSVETRSHGFIPLRKSTNGAFLVKDCPSLGYYGVWLVGGGRDSVKPYEDDAMTGYQVTNSCGRWIVATRKAA